jgi:protein SCO1/2
VAAGAALALLYVNRSSAANQSAGVPGVTAQFTLTTSDGRAVSDETYCGKWLLVYFGFIDCPQACPATLLSIGGALTALGHWRATSSRCSSRSIRRTTRTR